MLFCLCGDLKRESKASEMGDGIVKSPLGCILYHWRKIAGLLGGNTRQEDLIQYCNQWWLLHKLEDGCKRLTNGTLNCDPLLQLMFLRQEEKWDETISVDMFFTLRNHPEWQRECGINPAPSDPLLLSLEKDEKKQRKEKPPSRCCLSCATGQRCLKLKPEEREEEVEVLIAC